MTLKFEMQNICKVLHLFLGLFFVISGLYAAFYLVHTWGYLSNWYIGLNNCFYRCNYWQTEVFTQTTKNSGNKFCVAAITICFAGIISIWYKLKNRAKGNRITIKIPKVDLKYVTSLILICTCLWLVGAINLKPAFDEVFSAINCAGKPTFQTVSYYMLPNNHIGFNFFNNILFGLHCNKVFTGRLMSLVAFWGIAVIVYWFFLLLIKSSFFSFLGTLVILLQFPVWGFSFQARGYEWYAFAELLSFLALYHYIYFQKKEVLYIYAFSCILGYFFIPTFFYIHIGEMVFMVVYLIIKRDFKFAFWNTQAIVFVITYLLYLPALCFSGAEMLLNNPFVKPGGDTKWVLSLCIPYVQEYATYCFTSIISEYSIINDVLFLSPLLLLFFL